MMETPIADFVKKYAASETRRFHMPGHKGRGLLGCESLDITEIKGADALYEASGIIEESEKNASALFGTASTVYSCEGSSLCIRTMLYLAVTHRNSGCSTTVLAARNVHHSFIAAAALLDFKIEWLWPEKTDSLCACIITQEQLEEALSAMPQPPAAVYLTSPDYLGNLADIKAFADICHRHGTYLIVDQAHGAYLHFLKEPLHAIDLGADICCDSAHKTLPVLTGGAYLHFSENTPEEMRKDAKRAMMLFGSTSPSYLILQSLDLCNRYLADEFPEKLEKTVPLIDDVKKELVLAGWKLCGNDPLRITLRMPSGLSGYRMADILRERGAECEYADPDFLVLMLTPENTEEELEAIPKLVGRCPEAGVFSEDGKCTAAGLFSEDGRRPAAGTVLETGEISLAADTFSDIAGSCLASDSFSELVGYGLSDVSFTEVTGLPRVPQALTPREAAFRTGRRVVSLHDAVGHISGSDTVSCPPCIPIVVAGEVITKEAAALMARFNIREVEIIDPE